MSLRPWIAVVLLAAGAVPAGAGGAKPGEALFEEIFGAEARKVSLSASRADDVAFAGKLLAATATLTEAPELRALLYVKAYEFALKDPGGYATALSAVDRLAAQAPDRADPCHEMRLEVYSLQYRRASTKDEKISSGERLIGQSIRVGDAKAAQGKWKEADDLFQRAFNIANYIRSGQKDLAAEKLETAKIMGQAEALHARLKQADSEVVRTALIRLYVCELDDPKAAVPFLNASVSEAWRTYVPLAARPAAELAGQACLELGNWYKSLAATAAGRARNTLNDRTRRFYKLYLRKLVASKPDRSTLDAAWQQVNDSLKELGLPSLRLSVQFDEPEVQEAFDKAVGWLWSQQLASGNWQYGSGASSYAEAYNVQVTAQAVSVLLAGGASADDPRLVSALRFLANTETPYTTGLALRCEALLAAERQKPGQFLNTVRKDARTLIAATNTGGYGLRAMVRYATASRNVYSWCGPMGVAAAEELNVKAPPAYWRLVLSHWAKQQTADGGWSYGAVTGSRTSYYTDANPTYTAMGVAVVAQCLGGLHGPEAVRRMEGDEFALLRKGVAWLDTHLKPDPSASVRTALRRSRRVKAPKGSVTNPIQMTGPGSVYELFMHLSRAGLATGRESFGGIDWFDKGAEYLLSVQNEDGSWGNFPATYQVVQFLINGQRLQSGEALPAPVAAAFRPAVAQPPDQVREQALGRLRSLKERLAKSPGNRAVVEEIVRLHVMELRDLPAAATAAAQGGQNDLADLVQLAAQSPDAADEDACMSLGEWYHEMAGASGAAPPARKYVLQLAGRYYQRFLTLHAAGDAKRLKATLGLQRTQKALAEGG